MLLKPFEDERPLDVEVLPPSKNMTGIQSILGEVGLAAPQESEDEEFDPSKHIQSALKANGAGLDAVARKLSSIMAASDSDSTSLKAAESILKLHGLLQRDIDDGAKVPVINITIQGSGNKTLINVLVPTT